MKSLIVEDDPVAEKLLQVYLSGYGDIFYASDGREAVQAVEESLNIGKPYDLICLDIMMPEMDGLEALKHIRNLERDHAIDGLDGAKVIVTTSRSQPRDIFRAFKAGCEAYVVKPVRKEDLVEEMKKLGLIE